MCGSPLLVWRIGVRSFFNNASFSSSLPNCASPLVYRSCRVVHTESDKLRDLTFLPSYIAAGCTLSPQECELLSKDMIVHEDFLSEQEEMVLMNEIEPHMKRLRYEFDHWDDAIHGFRETEQLHWSKPSTEILNRVRAIAFPPGKPQLKHVHVLDLSENGYIKPHIDSVRFCGDTIAGLSLLSNSVMRLTHEKVKEKRIDVLLKRKSLYIMRNSARYDFTHEILSKENSSFKGEIVPRERRISVICRSEVPPS